MMSLTLNGIGTPSGANAAYVATANGIQKPITISQRGGASTSGPRAAFVYVVDEVLDVVDRRFRHDAVTEVEDVAVAAADFVEDRLRLRCNGGAVGTQHDRIEI